MRQSVETLTPDLCVIGGGSGGLSVAAGAVQMGASVVLIEAGEMGGDCLNVGCVPSKSLIAAAAAAQAAREAAPSASPCRNRRWITRRRWTMSRASSPASPRMTARSGSRASASL